MNTFCFRDHPWRDHMSKGTFAEGHQAPQRLYYGSQNSGYDKTPLFWVQSPGTLAEEKNMRIRGRKLPLVEYLPYHSDFIQVTSLIQACCPYSSFFIQWENVHKVLTVVLHYDPQCSHLMREELWHRQGLWPRSHGQSQSHKTHYQDTSPGFSIPPRLRGAFLCLLWSSDLVSPQPPQKGVPLPLVCFGSFPQGLQPECLSTC